MKLEINQPGKLDAMLGNPDPSVEPVRASPLGVLHMSAAMLVDRYLLDPDPCVAVCLSRQFRLISEDTSVPDAELKVLYRTLAARWHQMAVQSPLASRPRGPWLDEFALELRG